MRLDLHTTLKASRATSRQPLRWALVSLQVALCTLLLFVAGVLVSTFQHLRALDPGFDRDHIVTFSLDPGLLGYHPNNHEACDYAWKPPSVNCSVLPRWVTHHVA